MALLWLHIVVGTFIIYLFAFMHVALCIDIAGCTVACQTIMEHFVCIIATRGEHVFFIDDLQLNLASVLVVGNPMYIPD